MREPGLYNMDCMEALKEYPDNYWDLCIADPPYGDGGVTDSRAEQDSANGLTATKSGGVRQKSGNPSGGGTASRNTTSGRHFVNGRRKRNSTYQDWRNVGGEVRKKIIAWDVAPGQEFFDELFRVSRNQIIWGANYFQMPPTRCFVVWKKLTISEKFSMAMAEYAWTSFDGNAKVFEAAPQDPTRQRFHPTQKPVALYEWLLALYAKPGDKILDPMAGSGTCLVACRNRGLECTGFEIDEVYYQKAKERIERESAQMNIFDFGCGV